jgi:Domain of unknown function (DUF4375)
MTKATLHQKDIESDPNIYWNAFIEVVGDDGTSCDTEVQLHAHYCFRYYNEVMNGGHFQFYENNGLDYAARVLRALEAFDLQDFHSILSAAKRKASSRDWGKIEDVEEFVRAAGEELFITEDDLFYELEPDLLQRLQDYALAHKDEFFQIIKL